MEKFYIEIDKDNNPIDHPILFSNLINIYGKNIPNNFVPFIKVSPKEIDIFEIDLGVSYHYENGNVIEIHNIRKMSEQEISNKINEIKKEFYEYTGFKSWTFSFNVKTMIPPKPYPENDPSSIYEWNEQSLNWIKITDDRYKGG